jgi:hypothetical protein
MKTAAKRLPKRHNRYSRNNPQVLTTLAANVF